MAKIKFNKYHIPSRLVYEYAKKVKSTAPKIWKSGGNIFGNEAWQNLERVMKRGYWLDSEEWMYIKWRSFVARHSGDFRLPGIVANLKWMNEVEKGLSYMKTVIQKEYTNGKK